jgi:hypothetical protein
MYRVLIHLVFYFVAEIKIIKFLKNNRNGTQY